MHLNKTQNSENFKEAKYNLIETIYSCFVCFYQLNFLCLQLLLLLLLLSRFSRVRLCTTPEMTAHQAPPSLGFSRQEHWSGLPFPSPMHESEKWKWSRSVVSDSLRPHGLQPTRLLHPWDFPGKSTGVGCHCLLQGQLNSHMQKKRIWTPIYKNHLKWITDLTQELKI